jgi:Protein of unknown function (DUF2695)
MDGRAFQNLCYYLALHLGPEDSSSCDLTLKWSRKWLRKHGYTGPSLAANVAELEEQGGYCDCEVLSNVESRWA